MQQHSSPRIPSNRVIPHYESALQQKLQAKYELPSYNPQEYSSRSTSIEAAVLKYYPKYCYSLQFDQNSKSSSVLSRIKQIKTLYHFEIRSLNLKEKKTLIKLLLKNKRKSLKSLPTISFNSRITELSSFFPKTQTLKILGGLEYSLPFEYPNRRHFVSESLEKQIEKLYGHFWKTLKNVQSLHITTFIPYFWVVFQQINSSPKFLSSLKDFSLTIGYYVNQNPTAFFQLLLRYPGLLNHVTHLDLQYNKKFHSYGDQVKAILEHCSKLVSLSFPIKKDLATATPYLALAPLQAIQNIKILCLKVWDVWAMIQAFEFPALLEKLTVNLYYRSSWRKVWHELFFQEESGPLKIKNQEQYQIWLNFFEKMKKLQRLRSMYLEMPRFTETNQIMHSFIFPLLKAVPKIESLEFRFYQEYRETIDLFDISIFFKEIRSLSALKSLKLFQKRKEPNYYFTCSDWVLTFNPQKPFDFTSLSNLESLSIDSWITQDFDFKGFFEMCALSAKTAALKEVNLSRVFVNSIEPFGKLLNAFENIEISGLKISLEVILCVKSLTQIIQYFSSPVVLPDNVLMDLDIYLPSSKEVVLNKKGEEIMQRIFEKLKFNLNLLLKGSSEYYINSKSIIKNNQKFVSATYNSFATYRENENYKNNIQTDEKGNDQEYFCDPVNDDESGSN